MLANYEVEMLTEDWGRGVVLWGGVNQRQSGEVENEMVEEGECETGKRRLIGNEGLNWQVQLLFLFRDL